MTKAKTRARALQSLVGGPLAVAAYGSWKSPITSNLIARQSIKLPEVRLEGDDIYWLEDRPLAGVHGLLTMASFISATFPTVACIAKIAALRSRTRSRPHLLRRKEIGAMPMALSIEPGSGGSECAKITLTPSELIPTIRSSLSL
jgi:hypothetical protein